MNKFYIIVPVVLLGVFAFLYSGALKDMAAKEHAKEVAMEARRADEAKRKAEIEAKASAESKARQEQRDAEEAAKVKKREDDYAAVMKTLNDDTTKLTTESDALAKEAADLEIQIATTRTEKEKLNREALEIAKQVELAKINRRNAELEIQRMVAMVGQKVGGGALATPPKLPAPSSK